MKKKRTKKQLPSEIVNFKIDNVDIFGQGVSKLNDKIVFIQKTLPGETGTALITGKKKKVAFAKLVTLATPSPLRASALCPHYNECVGCQFLHTSYATEIAYKKNNFKHNLQWIAPGITLIVISAPKRSGYRNRIQLHYDIKKNQLGLINSSLNKIVEVAECILPTQKLQEKLKQLYSAQSWQQLLPPDAPARGHIEIYQSNDQNITININQAYAAGGFSQVNQMMNESLVKIISDFSLEKLKANDLIIDLFGGSGNLSQYLVDNPVLIVDQYKSNHPLRPHQTFLKCDLFNEQNLSKNLFEIKNQIKNAKLLIIDPPRSGHKKLVDFVHNTQLDYIIYVSCNHSTMIRDISPLLPDFNIEKIYLLDLFPSTYHFESITILKKV